MTDILYQIDTPKNTKNLDSLQDKNPANQPIHGTGENETKQTAEDFIREAITNHHLTDALDFLEKRGIPTDWAIELLPLIQFESEGGDSDE